MKCQALFSLNNNNNLIIILIIKENVCCISSHERLLSTITFHDPRLRQGNFRCPNTLSFVSFAGMT